MLHLSRKNKTTEHYNRCKNVFYCTVAIQQFSEYFFKIKYE